MLTTEEIRENYKHFPDSKIENIAKYESKGLRKDAVQILKEEIEKRNLDKNLISWVNAETKSYEGIERESLIQKFQNLPCPKCLKKEGPLYGFEINKISSVLLLTFISRKEMVLCLSCGKMQKFYALLITFFSGWWSVKGFLLTSWTLLKDSFNYLILEKISNKILNRIIDENTADFRLNGTENKNLQKLIKYRNQAEIPEGEGYDFS